MQTRLSLSPEDEGGDEARHWATFSDVALSILLVFMLFILAQFLQYEKLFILEEIERRKAVVESEMSNLGAEFPAVSFDVFDDDDLTQRIRVTGELVFLECRDDLTGEGRSLLNSMGDLLSQSQAWFASVQVEGHADRQRPSSPICAAAGIEDNWQLSARRATEVVRVFSGAGLVNDTLLSSVGRSSFQPLSLPGDTSRADLRQDRRIEIVLRYTDQIDLGGGNE